LAYLRDTSVPGLKPMPPVGIDHVDDDGLALVRSWIESLED
jgi:hypothetical protein